MSYADRSCHIVYDRGPLYIHGVGELSMGSPSAPYGGIGNVVISLPDRLNYLLFVKYVQKVFYSRSKTALTVT